jgi:hypothetical protein
MKRILLISSLCLIAFGVFGQNQGVFNRTVSAQANIVDAVPYNLTEGLTQSKYVPSNTPIVLAPQEKMIGKTKYDTQTNKSFGSRFYMFPDGRMVATWTGGVQDPPNFPDRGGFYNYFDGTNWTGNPDNIVRIENERTGWPSWAPLGNGEVLVSHHGSTTVSLWARETVGTGTWTKKSTLPGTNCWARICVNDGVIHLITVDNTDGATTDPQHPLLYSKSTDGGVTWNPQRVKLNTLLPNYDYLDHCYSADSYVWAEPKNGIIALSLASAVGDLVVFKSEDNGASWQKKVAWLNPYKNQFYPFGEQVAAPTGHSLIIDDDGICHIAFMACSSSGGNYSNKYTSHALYWNETLNPFTNYDQNEALDPDVNMQIQSESRLILAWSFVGEDFVDEQMVLYSPFGMIHKIHMALAGPDRLIVALAVQDHTTMHPTNLYYYSRIFACSYVKEGEVWKFDENWHNDLASWGHPGWLRVNKEAHLQENCTHPQIVVDKTNDASKQFHIFFMVDDMPGGALEGTTGGENNPQYNVFTDNYFVVYSDLVTYAVSDPPIITTASLPNGEEGAPYDITLTATGTPPITWSLESGELPTGLTLDALTGKISGTPTEKNKLSEFVVKATNAFGNNPKSLSIYIDPAVINITTENLPNGAIGVTYNQTLTATGATPITWSIESGELPLGLTLNAETGNISGTPTEKNIKYDFEVKAVNKYTDKTKPLSIYIDSVNSIVTLEKSPILVYPNPAFDILLVVNKNQDDMNISVFDFLGREVINNKVSGTAEIDVSKLPAGVYNIRIQYANTVETRKVVKK